MWPNSKSIDADASNSSPTLSILSRGNPVTPGKPVAPRSAPGYPSCSPGPVQNDNAKRGSPGHARQSDSPAQSTTWPTPDGDRNWPVSQARIQPLPRLPLLIHNRTATEMPSEKQPVLPAESRCLRSRGSPARANGAQVALSPVRTSPQSVPVAQVF